MSCLLGTLSPLVTPLSWDIDYLLAEYCFERGFQFLIPGRYDWNYNTILDVYTDGSKLDNGFGNGVYSGKLDLKISLRLLDYCSLFQAEVMAI